ncbi:N-acetyltransferase [Lentilactobacillus sp. SPB1-3]|uniref:N-acetyltransferase n=1 Tax=Lentilactobacillus terminaliae TaxID=3003483 RepID=A0ACD5DEA6_9LACO|nr:N-acetyltransferase [Lentilactobacillus sp. SPB1-3]MCZ0977679.1 N-acetyltransferase [Lentilactobacillus sp. SPB1-3]
MIRDFALDDIDDIMHLWLETNKQAHDFIESSYWENNFESVKEMMPHATIYVYESDGQIQGFIGLMDDYIAGIFISKDNQFKGIGTRLLNYTKEKRDKLTLEVYKKNTRAVQFYLREDFNISKREIDEETGESEYFMEWSQL